MSMMVLSMRVRIRAARSLVELTNVVSARPLIAQPTTSLVAYPVTSMDHLSLAAVAARLLLTRSLLVAVLTRFRRRKSPRLPDCAAIASVSKRRQIARSVDGRTLVR